MRPGPALALLLAAGDAAAAPSLVSQSDPHPGIHLETWSDSAIPATLRLITVDLTSSEIALYATREADRGLLTSEYAARIGAQVAVNGDAFSVAGYVPRGLAIGNSDPWSNTMDDATSGVFHLRRVGERTYAGIVPPEVVVTPGDLPAGTEGAVSGRPLLVRSSVVAAQFDCNDPVTLACQRAPRTAVAVSADGNTMWMVVVDGWQPTSLGLTAAELGAFLQARGADMALMLDSGSSSTLVLDGAVINSPSDGLERTVANQLAVKYGALPKGEMQGLICKHSVSGCSGDSTRWIVDADVVLDDGRSQLSSATGGYDFTDITPRLACVTVHKTGYLTATRCRQVVAGQLIFNSIPMFEGTDPPDAGMDRDSGITADGATGSSGDHGDAGTSPPGPGGCCDAGRDDPVFPAGVSVVFGAWFLRRRRGTTA